METNSRKRNFTQLDQISEPSPNATIHGAVTSISPIKKGRLNNQFFDATLADTTSSIRLVGFSTQQQIALNELHNSKSPVELTNCVLKPSRHGQGFDVMLKSNTQIRKSSRKLNMETIMTSTNDPKPITLNILPTLNQYDKVSVNVKAIRLLQPEQVGQDKKIKRDVIVADGSGTAKVVLWEQHIDALQEGKSYSLNNFHVKEFKGKKHLSVPKADFEITPIDDIQNVVNEVLDDDEVTVIQNPQIIGVIELDNYRSCLQCKARVEPQTPPLGKCTREDCLMIQLFDICPEQIMVRVMLRYINDGKYTHLTCLAYGDTVYTLANVPNDHNVTKDDFLKGQKISEVHIVNGKNIITFILRHAS